jgi:tRNA-splicing ligase RtcB
MTLPLDDKLRAWLAGPLPADVERALGRILAADDVQRVAVMPDVHLAEQVCVGTVVATSRLLYPDAVGGDIGCGVAAVRFAGGDLDLLEDPRRAARLLDALGRRIPTRRHGRATAPPSLPDELEATPLGAPALETARRRDGRHQLGTLGSGNHFLELQRDDDGSLWLMVHSGSRALGPLIRDHHRARGRPGPNGLVHLEADSECGRAYLSDLAWALRYAELNRRRLVEAAEEIIGQQLAALAEPTSYFDCHHNHVRREPHAAGAFWVHRKGAISAAAGEAGIIPGSMGSPSFHVQGRGAAEALCSSSHGAGRAMSRGDARRRITRRAFERQMEGIYFDRQQAERLRDEAPGAYKSITAVMRAQHELTRIVRRLQPLVCVKGA